MLTCQERLIPGWVCFAKGWSCGLGRLCCAVASACRLSISCKGAKRQGSLTAPFGCPGACGAGPGGSSAAAAATVAPSGYHAERNDPSKSSRPSARPQAPPNTAPGQVPALSGPPYPSHNCPAASPGLSPFFHNEHYENVIT